MGAHRRNPIILLLPFCALLATLTAQDSDQIQWVPLESPQLSRSELQWLDAMTQAANQDAFSQALDFIERQAINGSISSADRAAVLILRRIALSPYRSGQSAAGVSNPAVIDRIEAVRVMGYLGGDYSLDAVDELLGMERDAAVLSELFVVYREIAPPFNEHRHERFSSVLRRANIVEGDERLTSSILSAIRSMHERTWSMTSQELFDEVLLIVQSGMRIEVRRQALDLARLIAGVEIDVE